MVCHKMSSLDPEEDTELRDLVANTLQSCGVLGKIKVHEKIQIKFFIIFQCLKFIILSYDMRNNGTILL